MRINNTGFKTGFKKREEQKKLRQEYGIDKPEVVVVERKSRVVCIWRTTLKYLFAVTRIFLQAVIAVLAAIGLTTLIFPELRTEFYLRIMQTISELKFFVGL